MLVAVGIVIVVVLVQLGPDGLDLVVVVAIARLDEGFPFRIRSSEVLEEPRAQIRGERFLVLRVVERVDDVVIELSESLQLVWREPRDRGGEGERGRVEVEVVSEQSQRRQEKSAISELPRADTFEIRDLFADVHDGIRRERERGGEKWRKVEGEKKTVPRDEHRHHTTIHCSLLLQKLLDKTDILPCFLLVLDGLVQVEVEVTPLGETTSKVTATVPSDQLHVHAPR